MFLKRKATRMFYWKIILGYVQIITDYSFLWQHEKLYPV